MMMGMAGQGDGGWAFLLLTHQCTHACTRTPAHAPTSSTAHPLTHPPTHQLIHSPTYSLTHPPTHPPTHSTAHPRTHPSHPSHPPFPPTLPLTHALTHSLAHPLTHSLTHSQRTANSLTSFPPTPPGLTANAVLPQGWHRQFADLLYSYPLTAVAALGMCVLLGVYVRWWRRSLPSGSSVGAGSITSLHTACNGSQAGVPGSAQVTARAPVLEAAVAGRVEAYLSTGTVAQQRREIGAKQKGE